MNVTVQEAWVSQRQAESSGEKETSKMHELKYKDSENQGGEE